nr:flagellar basal-body MS-ring/collar protein FliF [Shimia biformata]
MIELWSTWDMRRRATVIGATLFMFAAILGLAQMAARPSMALLYSGLEEGASGEVIRALEQRGEQYEIRGDAIFVEATARDSLRMTLASEGLPANSSKGYELLDSLNGFGTTTQMFDAAYWRAKEGELARTIVASPSITSARVHIANGASSPFRGKQAPSASVAVSTRGGALETGHARALRHLVAAAVAGLAAQDVTIIDNAGNVIESGELTTAPRAGDLRLEDLRGRVERLLEARVGAGNAVVELSLDRVTQTESIQEKLVDPASRVAISTDTEERSTEARDSGSSQVTVASNLPDGDARGDKNSSQENNQTRERVNYEVSETRREITRAPGEIKRITVAVLVNSVETVGDDGIMSTLPRPEDELLALRELVASAVGFDETRGDVITIKSMPFSITEPMGTEAATSVLGHLSTRIVDLIQLATLALVALVLGLFVLRPILLGRRTELSAPITLVAEPDPSPPALNGEIEDPITPMPEPVPPTLAVAHPDSMQTDPVERLRAMIGERQEETVEILRSWLEDEREKA